MDMFHSGWMLMSGVTIGFWMVLIGGVLWAMSLMRRSGPPSVPRGARAVLDERYARGEIDTEEYRQRRDALRNEELDDDRDLGRY
jgi:putative membrane protein